MFLWIQIVYYLKCKSQYDAIANTFTVSFYFCNLTFHTGSETEGVWESIKEDNQPVQENGEGNWVQDITTDLPQWFGGTSTTTFLQITRIESIVILEERMDYRFCKLFTQRYNHSLKGYSDILWAGVHFSSHILILLYILQELSYTNLTSIGHLQKQNGFDKIDRSVQVFNFYFRK